MRTNQGQSEGVLSTLVLIRVREQHVSQNLICQTVLLRAGRWLEWPSCHCWIGQNSMKRSLECGPQGVLVPSFGRDSHEGGGNPLYFSRIFNGSQAIFSRTKGAFISETEGKRLLHLHVEGPGTAPSVRYPKKRRSNIDFARETYSGHHASVFARACCNDANWQSRTDPFSNGAYVNT